MPAYKGTLFPIRKMNRFIGIFTTFVFGGQLIFLCDCKGIFKPEPLTQTPQKGVPGEGEISTGHSFGPLSGHGQSVPELELVSDLSRVDPSKCEPSIYIAPVLNISTQTIEKKLAALNRQVQLLSEQVRILTSSREEAPPHCQELRSLPPRDCKDILDGGSTMSGTYDIQPEAIGRPIKVYCDLETDGGGWTVFQRRFNGSENFRRSWPKYRRGFGDVTTEFWLGLENLHRITLIDEYELRIELQDFDDIQMTSSYSWMRVDDITTGFKLHLGQYSGFAGDSLSASDGQKFSTFDRDNDELKNESCSRLHGCGGWWFGKCLDANPNGLYLGGLNRMTSQGIVWNSWKGPNYSLKRIEMKLRPCVGD